MDSTERLVQMHLVHRGLQEIVYEPDGNIPPDFSVGGRLAIEARRLNQHEASDGVPRGLEETAIPFGRTVRRALADFGPPRDGQSWFVVHSFRRPLPAKGVVIRVVRDALQDFARNPRLDPITTVEAASNVTLRFLRAGKPHTQMFVAGGSGDHDSGGFVVAELLRNLVICVEEKTSLTAPYRHRYSEWWLVFVDHIGYGHLDEEEINVLRSDRVTWGASNWQKVVVVSPLNPAHAIEL